MSIDGWVRLLEKPLGRLAQNKQVQAMITFTAFMHNALGALLIAGIVKANRERGHRS